MSMNDFPVLPVRRSILKHTDKYKDKNIILKNNISIYKDVSYSSLAQIFRATQYFSTLVLSYSLEI